MSLTINDKTVDPLLVTDGTSIAAYKGVTVTDTSPLSSTETVSITLSQSLSQPLGLNYSFYPTVTNLGSISDPNGGGTWNAATETFTESGLVSGDPTFATDLLKRLVYSTPQLPDGQGFAAQASITVGNGASSATDATPVIVADVAPPGVTGTVANEPIASGHKIRPFATVTLNGPYLSYSYYTIGSTYVPGPYYSYNDVDSATIAITDPAGVPTDADGLLTGPGLSKTGVGTYSVGSNYLYNLQNELSKLSFQTVSVTETKTANFELAVTDATSGLSTTDTKTSVLIIPGPGAPNIAQTQAGQTVDPGNTIDPFASVTISDGNANPTDSAMIALTNGGGTLTGAGLTAAGGGVYTLAATDPTTLTSELDSLTFQPTGSGTTDFDLTVTNPAVNKPTTDTTTTVTVAPKANFQIFDQSTGQTTTSAGTPYTGPTPGLSTEFIDLSPDNLNIAALTPNVFIYSGTGEDGIDVRPAGGNNTLDASGGNNFLAGGSGDDTFFLNDLYSTTPIWSTLLNFHAGDAATIWGVTKADFSISWMDGEGAGGSGYTGLTIHVAGAGKPAELLTLVGMTTAALSNGHLAVQFGTVNGTNYMEINHL